MSETHMKRAAEWFLTLREIPLERAHELLTDPTAKRAQHETIETIERDGPALYDTGLDAGEGLWVRNGWAGRS